MQPPTCFSVVECLLLRFLIDDDDDVYYYICWRLKLEGETENMGVCTKERKGVAAEVLMATPCTDSLVEEERRWFGMSIEETQVLR